MKLEKLIYGIISLALSMVLIFNCVPIATFMGSLTAYAYEQSPDQLAKEEEHGIKRYKDGQPIITEESAEMFVCYLMNRKDITQEEVRNSDLFKIFTGKYDSNDKKEKLIESVYAVRWQTGYLDRTASENENILLQSIAQYIDEQSKCGYLDPETNNELKIMDYPVMVKAVDFLKGHASNLITILTCEILESYEFVSCDLSKAVAENYEYVSDNYKEITGSYNKAKKIIEELSVSLQTIDLVYVSEYSGRYNYFNTQYNTYKANGFGDAMDVFNSMNELIDNENHIFANVIDGLTWLTGKDSYKNHRELITDWAIFLYELEKYSNNNSLPASPDYFKLDGFGDVAQDENTDRPSKPYVPGTADSSTTPGDNKTGYNTGGVIRGNLVYSVSWNGDDQFVAEVIGCDMAAKSVSFVDQITVFINELNNADAYKNYLGITNSNILISADVTGISKYAFKDCWNIKNMYFTRNLGQSAANLIPYTVEYLSAPGMTDAYKSQFYGYGNLKRVYLPDLKEITYHMFDSCEKLTQVCVNTSLKNIQEGAFENCVSLPSISLPGKYEAIPNYAFKGCEKLGSISMASSVKSIGGSAFEGCKSLPGVSLPSGLKEIGGSAFMGCTNLTSISIPNSVESLCGSAFRDCKSLSKVKLPNKIKSLEGDLFRNCTSLTSIVIPDSVQFIEGGVFFDACNLTEITMPNVIGIRLQRAFRTYGSYYDVFNNIQVFEESLENTRSLFDENQIPKSLKTIRFTQTKYQDLVNGFGVEYTSQPEEDYLISLEGFTSLETVILPQDIVLLETKTFKDCRSLDNIVLPNNVRRIGEGCFDGCRSLKNIQFGKSLNSIDCYAFRNCSSLEKLEIPNDVEMSYNYGMFENCVSLREVTLPEGLTSIDSCFFKNCVSLREIVIPDSVMSISTEVFFGCQSLSKITMPNTGVDDFFVDMFGHSGASEEELLNPNLFDHWEHQDYSYNRHPIYCFVPKSLKTVVFTKSNLYYTLGDDEEFIPKMCDMRYMSTVENIVCPDDIRRIGDRTFYNCRSLKNIYIPDEVESINNYAFYGCESLEEFSVPLNVKEIQVSAFENCKALKTLKMSDNVRKIWNGTFKGCASLTDIKLSDSLSEIPGETFMGCTSLKEVDLSENITVMGESVFEGCSSLEDIYLPKNVDRINNNTFKDCTDLISLVIPEYIKEIRGKAFAGCTKLNKVYISKNVEDISLDAFRFCSSLTDISVDEQNQTYCSIDGNLYNKQRTAIRIYAPGKPDEEFSIPDHVDYIDGSGFMNTLNLRRLIIPASVTYINSLLDYDEVDSVPGYERANRLTICGYHDTEAERYAESLDIPFIVLEQSGNPNDSETTSKYFASIEEMCNMSSNDYKEKTGVEAANAASAENADGTIAITLTDQNGNILDVYTIDPVTGIGTSSNGSEVNLPQTGNNAPGVLVASGAALLLMLSGAYAMNKSEVLRKKKEDE